METIIVIVAIVIIVIGALITVFREDCKHNHRIDINLKYTHCYDCGRDLSFEELEMERY